MNNNTRDSLGMLLAIIVFCLLRILLGMGTTFSLFVALAAGLILVSMFAKWKKKNRRIK